MATDIPIDFGLVFITESGHQLPNSRLVTHPTTRVNDVAYITAVHRDAGRAFILVASTSSLWLSTSNATNTPATSFSPRRSYGLALLETRLFSRVFPELASSRKHTKRSSANTGGTSTLGYTKSLAMSCWKSQPGSSSSPLS